MRKIEGLCTKCGGRPLLVSGLCKRCYSKQWNDNHLEERRQKARAYYAAHCEEHAAWWKDYRERKPEQVAAAMAEWQRANPERVAIRNAKWKAAHPDKVNAANRRRYAEDPAKHIARARRYQTENPHKKHEIDHRRRARLQGGVVVPIDPQEIYARDKGICQICLKPVPAQQMSLDHIVPIALGGHHIPTNVQLAHRRCNSRRGIRGPAQIRLV